MAKKQRIEDKPNRSEPGTFAAAAAVYLLVVAAYLVGSFFPEARAWGFSIMAYLPSWALATLLCGALAAGVGGELFYRRWLTTDQTISDRYARVEILAGALLLLGFYFLRAKTYFFGDGYSLLSGLTSENPVMEKGHEIIESLAHVRLYQAIGGDSESDAVLTFQIISISAGVLSLLFSFVLTRKLFRQGADRLLLFLGLASGGWTLLYFGYVENYSIFVLTLTLYCLTGMVVMQRGSGRWVVLLLQLALIALHIFGVTLIPATAYLLFRDSRAARWYYRAARWLQIVVAVVVLIAAAGAMVFAMERELFFRIALVPLVHSPFVPGQYTLFSTAHLIDYVNLLFLLIPGLLLLLIGFTRLPFREMARQPLYIWLGIAALGALGATFIFDPKLGMPRDWDVFSFCGIPLGLLLYYALISHRQRFRAGARLVVLAVLLGFVALSARGIWIATPRLGIAHFRNFLYLDLVKNRNSWIYLTHYYTGIGDTTAALAAKAEWQKNYPEEEMMDEANRLYYEQHDDRATEALLRRIIRINPAYADAYGFLGFLYLQRHQNDSALAALEISNALNPNRPNTLNNMAQAYYSKGDIKKAESLLLEAVELDSAGYAAQYNLARFYSTRRDFNNYLRYLKDAASHPEAPPQIVEELIVVYIRTGQIAEARRVYCSDTTVRADSTFIPNASKQMPGIDTLLVCR